VGDKVFPLPHREILLYDPTDDVGGIPVRVDRLESSVEQLDIEANAATQALDALQLPDYAALRAYKGPRKSVYVTGAGIAGMFVRDDADTASADNGGTVIVASGNRFKRVFDGTVDVRWFGASCDGVADDAAGFRAAVNSGIKLVDFLGLPTKISSTVIVPAGVSLVNVNAFLGAAGMSLFAVHSGVVIRGRITGTGATTGIERAVYAATDGVTDVNLDGLIVSACNYAVHAQPLSGDATPEANWPARWSGRLTLLDIPGQGTPGNGYGLVLSPAKDCNFTITAKNVNRHAVYLSAGARYNRIHMDVEGVTTSAAAQIYALASQSACIGNRITGTVRGLGASSQAHGVYTGVNSHRNEVDVSVFGGGQTAHCIEGDAATACWPEENIIKGRAEGVYRLAPYHQKDGARTKFYPTVRGYTSDAARGCVNIESSGTFADVGFAAQIFDASINALGNATYGIRSSVTQCPIIISPGVVYNNGAADNVRLSGSAKRIGCLRREVGQTKISNMAAAAISSASVTFAGSYKNPRVVASISKHLPTAGTVGSDSAVDAVTATGFTLTVKNGAATTQDITVDWVVEGD
jgi:hypothetical protein